MTTLTSNNRSPRSNSACPRLDFWSNQEKAQGVVGQLKSLKAVVTPLGEALKTGNELDSLLDMAKEDDSFAEEVGAEIRRLDQVVADLELKALLNGPHDSAGALVSINARDGGTDANDWAEMLLRMYIQWAQKNDYAIELLDRNDNEEAGITSATVAVRGPMAYGYLKGETGMHRLVRISPFNAEGKRQTSFAAVDVSPELPDEVEVEIDKEDVREDKFRASGAGGQHVNKTEKRHPPDPSADRNRRAVPERAEPAQEPGQRLEDAACPDGAGGRRETGGRTGGQVPESGQSRLRFADP